MIDSLKTFKGIAGCLRPVPKLKGESKMRVKYLGASKEQATFNCSDDPRGILKEGEVYEVTDVQMHSWHTHYTLESHPNKKFNSVCFEEVAR